MHDLFQFYQAFATKNFVGWENDSQSWNPCFLGVRSPNQLPKASWLGNLTSNNDDEDDDDVNNDDNDDNDDNDRNDEMMMTIILIICRLASLQASR